MINVVFYFYSKRKLEMLSISHNFTNRGYHLSRRHIYSAFIFLLPVFYSILEKRVRLS